MGLNFFAKNSLVVVFLAWIGYREKDLLGAVLQHKKSS
jgi:hypothetical protein